MIHPVLRRALAVTATSATAAGLLLVASPAAPFAAAAPITTANYNAAATASLANVGATALGLNVANAQVGPVTANANSPDANGQTSSATAATANLSLLGSSGVPIADARQVAPPDHSSPATFGPIAVPLDPLANAQLVKGSALARAAAAGTCLAPGALLSDSTVSTAGVGVLTGIPGVPAAVTGGVLPVVSVGAVNSESTTSLVSAPGPNDSRAVQSTSKATLTTVKLFGNSVIITLVGQNGVPFIPPTLTATANGTPGGATVTFDPGNALLSITVMGRTVTPPAAGATLPIPLDLRTPGPFPTGLLANIDLSYAKKVSTVDQNGLSASGSASVLSLNITADAFLAGVRTLRVLGVNLDLGPLSASATAPSGGVQCNVTPPAAGAPVITSPADGSTISSTTPPIKGTGATPGDTITVKDGKGNTVCTATVDANKNWMCTPTTMLPQGSITIIATETDTNGKTTDSAPVTFTVKTVEPAPVIVSPKDGSTINNGTVAITGTGVPGDTVTVTENGQPFCTSSVLVKADGTFTCNPPPLVVGSTHTVVATQKNPTTMVVSGPSNTVTFTTATTGTRYFPNDPYRVLDTRGTGDQGPSVPGMVPAGGTITLTADQLKVPAGTASAVVLNLTVERPAGPGFVSAYPSDQAAPKVSSLNYATGQTRANLVIVPVAADGSITLATSQRANLVADVFGYFATKLVTTQGGLFHAVTPSRLLDTRLAGDQPLGTGETRTLQVTGKGGVPATGVGAVIINVTVAAPTGTGYVSAFPAGAQFQQGTSNINFVPGDFASTRTLVPVSANGAVSFFNYTGNTQLVVDVTGYFTSKDSGDMTGGQFVAVDPMRITDSRASGNNTGALKPGETRPLQLTGGNIPLADTVGVLGNLTAVDTTAPGYFTQFATGTPQPFVSDVNFTGSETVANAGITGIDSGGKASVFNYPGGSTDVVQDVSGYFTTGPTS